MKRTYGKSEYFDFAEFANLGGRDELTEEERASQRDRCGFQPGLSDDEREHLVLVHSENMYRAASLMAYGIGLACFEDISAFASRKRIKTDVRSLDGEEEDAVEVEVILPYMVQCFDIVGDTLRLPNKFDSALRPLSFRMPYVSIKRIDGEEAMLIKAEVLTGYGLLDQAKSNLRGELYRKGASVGFTDKAERMLSNLGNEEIVSLEALRAPYKVLGQLIVNEHAAKAYIGMYDGKPEFAPRCYIDSLWQAMAELKEGQLPGICPICGKVIDRRRDARGGHPKNTCCNSHSDKFSNERRRIRDESIADAGCKSVTDSAELERIVRRERWAKPERNARPLRFAALK